MIYFAGKRYPRVNFAWPVSQPPRVRHSARSSGPAARWIAPSTPPPPRSELFAAFTIASTWSRVMSPRHTSNRAISLEPDFDLVTVGIAHIGIRAARGEFAAPQQTSRRLPAPSVLQRRYRRRRRGESRNGSMPPDATALL